MANQAIIIKLNGEEELDSEREMFLKYADDCKEIALMFPDNCIDMLREKYESLMKSLGVTPEIKA